MNYKKIGDVCHSLKKSIKPVSDVTYNVFSLPAFDDKMRPEKLNGNEIKSNKFRVYENTILFNKLNVKYRRIWNIHKLSTDNNISSTEFIPLVAEKDVDQDYLYYCLRSDDVTFAMHAARKGTSNSQQRIDENILFSYEIPVPSLEEQRKIAAILTSLDERIKVNERINDNLLQQAQAIYDEICIDCELVKLESLISVIETGSRPKGGAESEGVPSIGAEKIERFGTYDFSGEKYISEKFFCKLKRGIVLSGDVLLYKDGAYTGKTSMALDGFPHEKCAVNEHVFILRTRDNFAQYFLYFTLSSPSIREKIYTLACGKAAQPGLNQQELFSVEAPIPPDDVLRDFDKQVDPLMHAIALNALENLSLSNLRDSLLPRLMSGEIDVDSIEL